MILNTIPTVLLLVFCQLALATDDVASEEPIVAAQPPQTPTILTPIEPENNIALDTVIDIDSIKSDGPVELSSDEKSLSSDDKSDMIWDFVPLVDKNDKEDDDIDKLLEEIDNKNLSDDFDSESDDGLDLPEDFDTSSDENEKDVQIGVESCMNELQAIIEPTINMSEALLEARKSVLENDIDQVGNVETILMQQPNLINELIRNSPTLVQQCGYYKEQSIETERKASCLSPKGDLQTSVADATVDRITYGFGLNDYPILLTYHDLMAICDSAIDAMNYSRQQQQDMGYQELELSVPDRESASPQMETIVG